MATIGIEWVNKYHGRASDLKNRADNARGFYNTLDGVRQFDYGDDSAWDRDFEQQGVGVPTSGTDQLYADNVDIVYFSGHGSTDGPFFGVANYDDGTAKSTEMRLGDNWNAEWIVFDACSVLAFDDWAVFGRWGWPVFKGLHQMLGFHNTAYDSGSRGRAFAQYLNAGWTVREAWIRACEDTEDSSVYWAVLGANQSSAGTDTWNDHWHGKGYVSPDPSNPDSLYHQNGPC
jgi:hypothetical protein